jgi:hypothetical protein
LRLRPASARKFFLKRICVPKLKIFPFLLKKWRAKSKKSKKIFIFGSPVSFSKELDGGSGTSETGRKNGGGNLEVKEKRESRKNNFFVYL